MAAKSPEVQPMRQRNVLMPARRHVGLDDQKESVVGDAGVATAGVLLLQGFGPLSHLDCRRAVHDVDLANGMPILGCFKVRITANDGA